MNGKSVEVVEIDVARTPPGGVNAFATCIPVLLTITESAEEVTRLFR